MSLAAVTALPISIPTPTPHRRVESRHFIDSYPQITQISADGKEGSNLRTSAASADNVRIKECKALQEAKGKVHPRRGLRQAGRRDDSSKPRTGTNRLATLHNPRETSPENFSICARNFLATLLESIRASFNNTCAFRRLLYITESIAEALFSVQKLLRLPPFFLLNRFRHFSKLTYSDYSIAYA